MVSYLIHQYVAQKYRKYGTAVLNHYKDSVMIYIFHRLGSNDKSTLGKP